VVDDDKMICETLIDFMESLGHDATYSLNLRGALERLASDSFDILFLDIRLPDGNGLDALPKIHATPSRPEVIVITGEGDRNGAELAMKSGCWDYLVKPVPWENLKFITERVLKYRREKGAGKRTVALKLEGIVGNSPEFNRCLDFVANAANTDANVLITGETGTGKELFSRAIHQNSQRAEGPFVVVDCAVLPETLFESLLFGHEKGAFTGATQSQQGLLKTSNKGTLFLDEIGELTPKIQRGFLRVLEEHSYRPLGDSREMKIDFRLIAATHRDLQKMVDEGEFRSDLLFRMKSIVIEIPPLRNRKSDIVDIAFHYMRRFCDKNGIATKGFSPDFLEDLMAYEWPGNVRELIHAIERSLSIGQNEGTLYPIHLPVHIRTALAQSRLKKADKTPETGREVPTEFPEIKTVIEQTERQYLKDLLSSTGGSIPEICRISGLSKTNVYNRLKKYNLTRRF